MASLVALTILAADVTVRLYWLQGGGETVKMPLDEYVSGVLGGEAAGMKSQEALKAISVAARTYAVRFRGRHLKEGFDFCDTTHCQDFRRSAITEAARTATEATEGELLWYKGSSAATYYGKSCGGITEASEEGPYLRQRRDPYCVRQPDVWRTVLSREELARALKETRLPVPAGFTQIAVTGRTPSNRATRMNFSGYEVNAVVFQNAVGRAIGWDRLPSGWFDVTSFGDRFVFAGQGRGHGIGLCQDGCARMGEDGKTYREILQFYYPGTIIGLTASGISWKAGAGERVDVIGTRIDSAVVAMADAALREAEQRSGIAITGRPKLRIYPTIATFRDATGEAGSTAAVSRGLIIRLQPVETLRARRILESTLLHEMLHVVLESHSAPNQPWWFREGLVLALANETPADPQYRDAATRVNGLLARFGRETVFGWWQRGLPRDASPGGIDQRPSQRKPQRKTEQLPAKP